VIHHGRQYVPQRQRQQVSNSHYRSGTHDLNALPLLADGLFADPQLVSQLRVALQVVLRLYAIEQFVIARRLLLLHVDSLLRQAYFTTRQGCLTVRHSVRPLNAEVFMSERALVLSCDSWDMTDEKTGEMRRGLSVWYVNDYRDDGAESLGLEPTKVSADRQLLDQLRDAKLPALFDLDLGSRPGAQGKATLTLVGLKLVQRVELFRTAQKAGAPASV
jgi:hypothetical protein